MDRASLNMGWQAVEGDVSSGVESAARTTQYFSRPSSSCIVYVKLPSSNSVTDAADHVPSVLYTST